MKTKRAYIIDAVIRYICGKGLTPYVMVDVAHPGVMVPMEYVQKGYITLNLRPAAISNFELNDDGIRFSARFNRVSRFVVVPLAAVCSIYPKEDIRDGIYFTEVADTHFSGTFVDEEPRVVPPVVPEAPRPEVKGPPKLSIVKGVD